MNDRICVIGAGLAGCEAAYQLAQRGYTLTLYEMKPHRRSQAHHSNDFAELVCSNSLRSDRIQNAVGLLKEEMRTLDSLIIKAADATRVPAGGALAVDRDAFARMVTDRICHHPNIEVVHEHVCSIPDAPAIIATGPLTDGALYEKIERLAGKSLHFYDAAAPIVLRESLDEHIVFRASRYERGNDYLNCPMTREDYYRFYRALVEAQTVPLKQFETPRIFEGCMPIEVMAKRGEQTLLFGPLKPVGLKTPDGKRPFAVVQLRQDDEQDTMYNIVGFQTNLTFPEQKRVFQLIPGLEHAEFVRFGVMHRNTFVHAPGFLNWDYQCIGHPGLFFAGQITGVEGYVESAASGLVAGINLARLLRGQSSLDFTRKTALGSLGHYIAHYNGSDFQPMNVTFSLIEPLEQPLRNKQERYERIAKRALETVEQLKRNC